jgi:hypothetical protein
MHSIKDLSRHEKEMGIQVAEMEKYKWICSQQSGCDVGKQAYFEWIHKHSKRVRQWLESLTDEEIDRIFNSISEHIKHYISNKQHK